jgi:adenylate kinase family enzyme
LVRSSIGWGRKELDHAFTKLRCSHLAYSLRLSNDQEIIPIISSNGIYFEKRLHEHLGYYSIPDSRFDPAELAFCLEGLLVQDRHSISARVVERVFEVLSEYQEVHPYWRPLFPFIGTERGMALFPISVEVANSLLRSCIYLDGDALYGTHFEKFAPRFTRYADWLQARVIRGALDTGARYTGWHSEHVGEPGTIHLWETSQVALYLMHYAALLQEHGARAALVASRFSVTNPAKKYPSGASIDADEVPATYWQNFVESQKEPMASLSVESPYRVLARVRSLYVAPRSADTVVPERYAILLYGPPGTGKTSFAEDLAAALGWRLVTITVSDFLAGGAAEVEARSKAIFDILNEQSKTVILMDELDSFLLDRDSKRYSEQEGIFQFMTPGMLTKLKNLRDRQGPIFIIATNYAERIDDAIKRRGRIDDQFVVLPYDSVARKTLLSNRFDEQREKKVIAFGFDDVPDERKSEILKHTALHSRGEINQAIDNAFVEFVNEGSGETNINRIGELLITQIDLIKPAITLVGYKTRLNGSDGLDNDIPIEEFLLLVFLIAESERDITQGEKSAIDAALNKMGWGNLSPGEIVESIRVQGNIGDRTIAERIGAALRKWRFVEAGKEPKPETENPNPVPERLTESQHDDAIVP